MGVEGLVGRGGREGASSGERSLPFLSGEVLTALLSHNRKLYYFFSKKSSEEATWVNQSCPLRYDLCPVSHLEMEIQNLEKKDGKLHRLWAFTVSGTEHTASPVSHTALWM